MPDEDFRGQIPAGNFEKGRRGLSVDKIVVHHEDCFEEAAEQHFLNPGSGVSAHGGINFDGSEDTYVDWGDTAYHAGDLEANLTSIGFEHEDGGDTGNPFTDAQYARSAASIAAAAAMFGIPLDSDHILPHSHFTQTACPGGLDIGRLIREAITPVPAPPPVPEWKANLVASPSTVELARPVPLYDLSSGGSVDMVAEGELTTAFTTKVRGHDYLVTQWAVDHDQAHGLNAAEVAANEVPPPAPEPAPAPAPDPVPAPAPQPDPAPPPVPDPPPGPPPLPPVPEPAPAPTPGPAPSDPFVEEARAFLSFVGGEVARILQLLEGK